MNSVDALEKETNFLEKLKKSLKNKPKTVEKPELPKDDKKLVKPLVKVADEDEDDEEEKIPTKAKK